MLETTTLQAQKGRLGRTGARDEGGVAVLAMVPALLFQVLTSVADLSTPFFYISLHKERGERIRRDFSHLTSHMELVPAVDGNASAHTFCHNQAHYNHMLKRNTASELGCALSHILAIQRAEAYCVERGLQVAPLRARSASLRVPLERPRPPQPASLTPSRPRVGRWP